jgi:hypothetical protein
MGFKKRFPYKTVGGVRYIKARTRTRGWLTKNKIGVYTQSIETEIPSRSYSTTTVARGALPTEWGFVNICVHRGYPKKAECILLEIIRDGFQYRQNIYTSVDAAEYTIRGIERIAKRFARAVCAEDGTEYYWWNGKEHEKRKTQCTK